MNLNYIIQSLNTISQQTQTHAHILALIIAIPWIAYLFVLLSGGRLLILGIYPRHLLGLIGIIFAPFLHANFNHLFFNSIPLLVFSNFLLIQGVDYFLLATVYIMVISGFTLWCFGKKGLHVGASAVITGYWAVLVSNIYQQGGVTNIILGIISLYYFAGIFFGIFPSKKGVSWEGHLFGFIAGFLTSYLLNTAHYASFFSL